MITLRPPPRTLAKRWLSQTKQLAGNNRRMAKEKQSLDGDKPLTYERRFKPHKINRIKQFQCVNTTNLKDFGFDLHGDNHAENAIYEDLFIKKFLHGVFWHQLIPEQGIAILRRLNEIEIVVTITETHNPLTKPAVDPPGNILTKQRPIKMEPGTVGDFYFKAGFVETILSHQLKRNVTCTMKFAYRDQTHYSYW
ncbi:unnamed protein product [Oikopleura dioica]|uniref:Uncharacterized protein n=1 Tax=Oikopleura dioica TaxID=34765 RepID=E4X2I9_OIKDI|nr:unnamed protein product [Oikopleura dioica]